MWSTRRAYHSTKIHQCLIEIACLACGEQCRGQIVKQVLSLTAVDGRVNAKMTGKHPIYIAIHSSHILTKCHRGYGSGSIGTNALEPHDFTGRLWKSTQLHHLFGSHMQMSGSAVIAQTLPQP